MKWAVLKAVRVALFWISFPPFTNSGKDLHTTHPHLIPSLCLDQPFWYHLIPSLHHLYFSLNNEISLARCKATSAKSWAPFLPQNKTDALQHLEGSEPSGENEKINCWDETIKPSQCQKQWKDVTQQPDKALDFADNFDSCELCLQILKETR